MSLSTPKTSLAQAAGQVLIVGFPAGEPPPELLEATREDALGGFILFKRNLPTLAEGVELIRTLRAAAPPGLAPWISVDQEGGRVARLTEPVLKLPPMRVLGQRGDVALTQRAGRLLGQQLHALGYNLDFAPVLDVDTHAASPVIGDRAFGDRPDAVVQHGRAFARGLQGSGVAACGKHFPGHGDTDLDSHLDLPRVRHDRERLERVELRPFADVGADVAALMTAHVIYDALDPEQPATLSPRILTELLRQRLGYQGLLISDDLEMRAISDHYGVPDAACRAIAAGCDLLLVCARPDWALETREALLREAERSSTFRDRLLEAAARSRQARLAFPGRMPDTTSCDDPSFRGTEARELAQILRES